MAKGANRKKRQNKSPATVHYIRPTAEREAANDFRSAGPAMRVVPVIVRLHEAGVLNQREFEALAYYRDQASLADRSPVRSCCDFSPRGGNGPGVSILSAAFETGRMERDMGALWQLCRAIAVDDMTLEQWCASRGAAPYLPGEIILFKSEADRAKIEAKQQAYEHALGIATLELKYAAGGIVFGRG